MKVQMRLPCIRAAAPVFSRPEMSLEVAVEAGSADGSCF